MVGIKKPLRKIIIIAPYVLLVVCGLIAFALYVLPHLTKDTVVELMVNRGNRFEMHYDNSGLSKHSLWVNGRFALLTRPREDEPADEFIKEFVMSLSNDEYSFFSYLIVDNTVIYKTKDMDRFQLLGELNTSDLFDCERFLQDMDRVFNRCYPIHATESSVVGTTSSEPNGTFGIYDGIGYRIEALTNGIVTEWQFYVNDSKYYGSDTKIYSLRW